MEIKVVKDVMAANEALAQENNKTFESDGVCVINLMAAPGAGKTSIIERSVEQLKSNTKIAVIEGDVASQIDAEKLKKKGIEAIQINTSGGCHLDANMVKSAYSHLSNHKYDLIFIENVGNLVCPAQFNLGETYKVTVSAVSEGDDKPRKYPLMFARSDALILNKIDFLESSDFNLKLFKKAVLNLNPEIKIFEVSAKTGEGIESWTGWLKESVNKAH